MQLQTKVNVTHTQTHMHTRAPALVCNYSRIYTYPKRRCYCNKGCRVALSMPDTCVLYLGAEDSATYGGDDSDSYDDDTTKELREIARVVLSTG
eukprot:37847-Eustigmatos_ZCMA.PRE.1